MEMKLLRSRSSLTLLLPLIDVIQSSDTRCDDPFPRGRLGWPRAVGA